MENLNQATASYPKTQMHNHNYGSNLREFAGSRSGEVKGQSKDWGGKRSSKAEAALREGQFCQMPSGMRGAAKYLPMVMAAGAGSFWLAREQQWKY